MNVFTRAALIRLILIISVCFVYILAEELSTEPPLRWGVPGGSLPFNQERPRYMLCSKIGYRFIFRKCRKVFYF